jgi:hypothetical protein
MTLAVVQHELTKLGLQALSGDSSYRAHEFWIPFTAGHWTIPIVACVAYFLFVHLVPIVFKLLPALPLRYVFVLWNFALSLFSIAGAAHMIPYVIGRIRKEGFFPTVCVDARETYFEGAVGIWATIFVLSKIPELGDTVLLILQKKHVDFLHWYHHITVLLYCWDALASHVSYGAYFIAMNYTVHSVMYMYFALASLSDVTKRLVRPLGSFITTIQILQMVGGMSVLVYTYLNVQLDAEAGKGCYQTPYNVYAGFAMYFSYFLLFSKLFIDTYITGSRRREKSAGGGSSSGASSPATPLAGTKAVYGKTKTN